MSGGKAQPTSTTQTTKVEMSPEQREIYQLAMPGIRDFAGKTPVRYGEPTVAGFDPSQTAGQEMILAGAGQQQSLADTAANHNKFLMGNIWDPASNPHLQGAIDAAARGTTENFTRNILPALRGGAVQAGQFGSSRQGIAEGLAAGEAAQTIGDQASQIVQGQYGANLDASTRALGLAPQTTQNLAQPGISVSNVGDVRQNMAQQLIDEAVRGFQFDNYAPFMQSQEILSLLSGIPGGTTTATGTTTAGKSSPLLNALGGGATGASLGSTFGPWGAVAGGGLGAILSFLK